MITRIVNAIRARLWPRYWYAVRHTRTRTWFIGEELYSIEFGASVWFDEPDEAVLALVAAGLPCSEHTLVRLHVQPQTNHYAQKEIPW